MNLALRWHRVLRDPTLRNLPFKIELNKFGQILMSPASNWHGYAQSELGSQLRNKKKNGKVINECSILTREGVRVADVAWASDAFIAEFGFKTPYPKSPELCIEVLSPGNTKAEIEEKVGLYLERGCQEVWIVNAEGRIRYFAHAGEMKKSRLVTGVKL